jgi:hypothetical protein
VADAGFSFSKAGVKIVTGQIETPARKGIKTARIEESSEDEVFTSNP